MDRQKLVDLVNRNKTACHYLEYDDVYSVLLKSKLSPKWDEWLLLKFSSSLNSFVSVYQLRSNFTSAHLVCILSSFAKFNPSQLKVQTIIISSLLECKYSSSRCLSKVSYCLSNQEIGGVIQNMLQFLEAKHLICKMKIL